MVENEESKEREREGAWYKWLKFGTKFEHLMGSCLCAFANFRCDSRFVYCFVACCTDTESRRQSNHHVNAWDKTK